jgi:hypothetical protein
MVRQMIDGEKSTEVCPGCKKFDPQHCALTIYYAGWDEGHDSHSHGCLQRGEDVMESLIKQVVLSTSTRMAETVRWRNAEPFGELNLLVMSPQTISMSRDHALSEHARNENHLTMHPQIPPLYHLLNSYIP